MRIVTVAMPVKLSDNAVRFTTQNLKSFLKLGR